MQNLEVRIELARGLGSMLSQNPLDGVLAKLYIEKLKKEGKWDGDWWTPMPFLQRSEAGYYHVGNPVYRVKGVANYNFYKEFDADEYEKLTGNTLPKTARSAATGPYKAHIENYELCAVEEVVFYCRGEMEAIGELLSGLKYLGKKSAHGLGKVSRITIREIEEDRSVVHDGKLMRPVPYDSPIRQKLSSRPAVRLMPMEHPYWDRGREVYCMVPNARSESEPFEPNLLTKNPPRALAEAFGFSRNYKPVQKRKIERIENNKTHKCKMCGRVQGRGYLDPKNALIGVNTNDFYAYIQPRSPFLCDWCHYNYSHYMKKLQKRLDRVYGDMSNIVLFEGGFEPGHFNADDKNELYDILIDPPKEPFAVILKQLAGTSAVNGTFAFLPTVDRDYLCVTYGQTNHFVEREKVFACIENGEEILAYAKRLRLNLSDEVLYNRMASAEYARWYSANLAASEGLSALLESWFSTYDRATRFVAKIVLRRWRKENKRKER